MNVPSSQNLEKKRADKFLALRKKSNERPRVVQTFTHRDRDESRERGKIQRDRRIYREVKRERVMER